MSRGALTGTRIRERRMMIRMRQSELARAVGISASYLNLIEHNKRRIGGKLLVDIAKTLSVDASALTEGAEVALLDGLRQVVAAQTDAPQEALQVEGFADRFPAWAQILVERQERVQELERLVEMLSDRLTHDPFLSSALHEVLSTVTAIRSTADILADTTDLDRDWQMRFHRNLRDDSHRLAEGAQALVTYLDDGAEGAQEKTLPQDEVDAFLRRHDYHLADLEGQAGTPEALIEGAAELESPHARELALRALGQYQADAAHLPRADLIDAITENGLDPGVISARFGVDIMTVFRRIASLGEEDIGLTPGLVMCDGSGTLTVRKPVAGFELPRYGAACPLWPLYAALTHPMTPIAAVVEQSGRPPQRFQTYAICRPRLGGAFSDPPIFEAAMLILPATSDSAEPVLPIGTSCRICSQDNCAARREPSILADVSGVGGNAL